MFTDMVGFTSSTQTDEAGALVRLKEEEDLVRPILSAHHGREVKSTGDGFLVEFDSALRAVECAIEIQQELREHNARSGQAPILLRVGVHLGDVEQRGKDIFGDAVNVAARIEPLAAPGGVCVSGPVYELVRNKVKHRFEPMEPAALKNVQVPIALYRVAMPWEEGVETSGAAPLNRIAVLPLANISPDPADAYFADGLTEELTAVLSKVRELQVVARTSAGQYKGTPKSVAQIGSELNVGTVLEGSVRKAGRRLRITLQLIDTRSQAHLWSENYDRDLEDVFAIQSEVAEKTAGALRIHLVGPVRDSIRRKPTLNLAAYNAYMKGIATERSAGNMIKFLHDSIPCFEEAIRLDPEFGQAYAELANVYIALSGEDIPAEMALPKARTLVDRALELAPESAEAHTARGNLAMQSEGDWALAEREFRRALEISPSHSEARLWYAILLRILDRSDEALEQIQTAIAIEPLWVRPRQWLAGLLVGMRHYAEGLAIAEEVARTTPLSPNERLNLAWLYAQVGRTADSEREFAQVTGPMTPEVRGFHAMIAALLGRPEEGRVLLREIEEGKTRVFLESSRTAMVYSALGEHDKALEILTREAESGRESSFWFVYQSPAFDPIRHDPRFRALLVRYHLPSSEPSSG